MTIAATRTLELNIETIIAAAMELAGLKGVNESTSNPNYAAKRASAMVFLETICKETQAGAIIDRHVFTYTAVVTAGSSFAPVTNGTEIAYPIGSAMYVNDGEKVRSPIAIIDQATYQLISDKTLDGQPLQAVYDRKEARFVLWPVPQDTGTITVLVQALTADVSNASNTLDFERHWTSFFIWELGHHLSLANGVELSRCAYMRTRAEEKLEKALIHSKNPVPAQMRVAHRTPWS